MQTFENTMEKLDLLLEQLNSEEITLTKSVELYKNGVELIKEARKILESSKLAIKEINEASEGQNE